jgi:hypothetical protein
MNEQELITAAAQHLTEDQSRAFDYAVRECVRLAQPIVPMEQIRIAAAIVSMAKRRLRGNGYADADDAAVAEKLARIEQQLDNLADSL